MNTNMAEGASERLDAQIADALFGQPGMSKMDVANRLRQLRGAGAPLLADVGNPVSPFPACQGDALPARTGYAIATNWREQASRLRVGRATLIRCAAELEAALAARQPVGAAAQAVDLAQFRQAMQFFIAYTFPGTTLHAEGNRLLALIDSKEVR